jgi:hypothetical protein
MFSMRKPIDKIIAHLVLKLRDLIPGYLKNWQIDIKTIIKSIGTAHFDKIFKLAHCKSLEVATDSCLSVKSSKLLKKSLE